MILLLLFQSQMKKSFAAKKEEHAVTADMETNMEILFSLSLSFF